MGVQRLQHLRLQRGFHRGERQIALVVEAVVVLGAVAAAAASAGSGSSPSARGRGRRLGRSGRRGRLGRRRLAVDRRDMGGGGGGLRRGLGLAFGTDGIHRFQVDDVAQEDLALIQLVAPHGQGFEGERAFAQGADHQLAAGLDALGDSDFALAAEQLDAAHLAQIHAHRIVGAVILLGGGAGLGGDFLAALGNGGEIVVGALFLFLGFDDVDAHLVEHRHRVLDLLGGHLVGGQNLVSSS